MRIAPTKGSDMVNVAIVTDSVASIPEALIESLGIRWVPYYIHRGQEVLRDLRTIQRDAFYAWLPAADELPRTANPSPADYLEAYRTLYLEQGAREIVSIHITSKGSGAYQSALIAKEMLLDALPDLRLEVIDTLNVAMCQGWMDIEAARAARAGKSAAEIVDLVKEMIPITRMIQTADTLRYLYLGGRIGKAKQLLGSLLNIKPLIGMEDGVIVPLGQARSRRAAYEKMVEMVEEAVGKAGNIKIAFLHAAAPDEAEKLKKLFEERLTCVESLIAELSPALGVHTGPGTAGICYFPVRS
jgi:DegV family protein with EDD domain